jgi:NADPH:quinone reductase-like Zn-dependent oxidoreductase
VAVRGQERAAGLGVRGLFFLVSVTSECLARIAEMIDGGRLTTCVGEVLPLSEARIAHEMPGGRPHNRGKLVLRVEDGDLEG